MVTNLFSVGTVSVYFYFVYFFTVPYLGQKSKAGMRLSSFRKKK